MDALVTMRGAGPDDVLGPSLAAAMRHPGLSVERERGIVARAQAGDVGARGMLAMAHTRLVVRVAHGFAGLGSHARRSGAGGHGRPELRDVRL